jgi:endonuclease/exonuclease/phosphatase (EEP) superfamily protein YafD
VVVAVLAAVAIARLVDWDGDTLLAEINSTNGLAYLPVWIVLPAAVLWRRGALALAALAVLAAQLAFAAPEVLAERPLPAWAQHAPSFRLFDANAGSDDGNTDMSGYAHAIAADHPALVTFEEIDPSAFAQLTSDGALRGLPYRYTVEGPAPWGFAIASRYPFSITQVLRNEGNPIVVDGTLALPGGRIRLWVVHTDAPIISQARGLADLERIARLVRTTGEGRLLVVGDFNASWGNRGFYAVVATGLADAAAARGKPFDMTWPQGEPLPPLVRIDHVLAGTGIATTKIATVNGPGSDHRALVATIAVRNR